MKRLLLVVFILCMSGLFSWNTSRDSYGDDSQVLLAEYNDIKLYGINQDETSVMLLSIDGTEILIDHPFQNFYEELPKLSSADIDSDGIDEVMISVRTYTGHIKRYALFVCDYEETWQCYEYEDYVQDIQDVIDYQYDKLNNSITLYDNKRNVLIELKLPEWTEEYPYAGNINFEDDMYFDAETMQLIVTPLIECENSLPHRPVEFVFDIRFLDGEFEIIDIEILNNTPAEQENTSVEEMDEVNSLGFSTVNWEEGEKFFYMLEGEWIVKEYAGMISDYHFDEAHKEGYMEEEEAATQQNIEENMDRVFRIEPDNIEYFAPSSELSYVIENDSLLADITRFYHNEFEMTAPYICVNILFKDKADEEYNKSNGFIIDASGMVLVEINYRYFKLERKSENLDGWIGTYTFDEVYAEEGYAPMFMDYDVRIYKEDEQYYADVVINGHMTAINVKAQVYGDDEWISLVLKEYNPDHITGLSNMENTVMFSMRQQEENIYTYWGAVIPLLLENSESGKKYFEKTVD